MSSLEGNNLDDAENDNVNDITEASDTSSSNSSDSLHSSGDNNRYVSPNWYSLDDFEDDDINVIVESSDGNSCNNFGSLSLSVDSIGVTSDTSHHEDFKSVITNESSTLDEQVSVNERNWSELPSLVVESIYSFLSRPDQSRMSQVCSQWAKHFNSPSLWKMMRFYLPEHDYPSKICPEVRFARKYALMFRHVEIICRGCRTHLMGVIWRQLKMFLQALESSSQLISIKFINMQQYLLGLDGPECLEEHYQTIIKIIIKIFNSQENLKTVVFEESRFRIEVCSELLKAIFHSDRNTIRNLTLRVFVKESVPLPEFLRSRQTINAVLYQQQFISNFSELCGRMANIQSLKIDYTQFFEGIMNCLYEKLSSGDYQIDEKKTSMWSFSIYCEEQSQTMGILVPKEFKGILPGTWKCLKSIFPGMKVKMDITIYSHLNRKMGIFLVKEIPLQTLTFKYCRDFRPMLTNDFEPMPLVDVSTFFRHLRECKYQDHLEVLKVVWMDPIDDFAGSVIPFVQSFKMLQTFLLHVRNMPSGVENVLKALLENHPTSLKSIAIRFSYAQDKEEVDNFRELSEEYNPLFNAQGIECFLSFHYGRLRRFEDMEA